MIAYVAARYSRKVEMNNLVPVFKQHNININSRWLGEDNSPEMTLSDMDLSVRKETALVDLEDIDAADMIVFFSEDPLVGTPRGGRHVEFGYALAKGKKIIAIGGPENIFHYVPEVAHYPTVEGFLDDYSERS